MEGSDGDSVTVSLTPEESDALRSHIAYGPEADVKTTDPVTVWSGNAGNEREEWNRQAIEAAAELGLRVEFTYAKGDGAVIEPRVLDVLKLDADHKHPVAVGVDPYRAGEYRAFRLDRITDYVRATGRHTS